MFFSRTTDRTRVVVSSKKSENKSGILRIVRMNTQKDCFMYYIIII